MAVYTRDNFDTLLQAVAGGEIAVVYLLVGDRYLCREAAGRLGKAILGKGGTLHPIDGDNEDYHVTLGRLRSFSLLPGRQLYRVMDTRLFHSKNVAGTLWKRLRKAMEEKKIDRAAGYLRNMLEAAGVEEVRPEELAALPAGRWKTVFGFAKPAEDLSWLATLKEKEKESGRSRRGKTAAAGDAAAQYEKVLGEGIPSGNILMLIAETVDKRKRLYRYIRENGIVVDLGVAAGGSSAARREQKQVLTELVRGTLEGFNMSLAPGVLDSLLERVGFHPVAAVRETEKLALYAHGKAVIDRKDLDAVVGRTRREAVFELTDKLGKGDFEQVLLVAGRLQEHGVHDLAVVSVVRKYVRTLLLFRALQEKEGSGYRRGMSAGLFQKQCLPLLKEEGAWTEELSGHPYAVYMQFKTAEKFSLATLQSWLNLLLQAEYRLKGSPVEPGIVLSRLFFAMAAETRKWQAA